MLYINHGINLIQKQRCYLLKCGIPGPKSLAGTTPLKVGTLKLSPSTVPTPPNAPWFGNCVIQNWPIPATVPPWYCKQRWSICISWSSFSCSHWCWVVSQQSSACICFLLASTSIHCFLSSNSAMHWVCSAIFWAWGWQVSQPWPCSHLQMLHVTSAFLSAVQR